MGTKHGKLSRRTLLQGAGAAAVATAAGPLLDSTQARVETVEPLIIAPRLPAAQSTPPLSLIVWTRLAFGPRAGDLAAFNTLGSTDDERLTAWVDNQITPNFSDDPLYLAKRAEFPFETLNKSQEEQWVDYRVGEGDDFLPYYEVEQLTFLRAIYSQWQLFEVLADFWHNHFNVFTGDRNIAAVFMYYDRDVIRANILGNFRVMLEAVAKSTAMLYYLDNYLNKVDGPNENWARELFELHSLGAENYLGAGLQQPEVPGFGSGTPVGYIDADVYEATRCFTGWTVRNNSNDPQIGNTGTFVYVQDDHDRFQKRVLAREIPNDQGPLEDGLEVLDLVANHPGTGRYIARKLCRRLIGDDPPNSLVNAVAQTFTDNVNAPDQLKIVVRQICLSNEFKNTWGQKIKRPFEFAVSALRATEADFDDYDEDNFDFYYEQMGQQLFRWGPPTGYPDDKEHWSSTVSMVTRWRMAAYMIDNWDDDDDNRKIDIIGQHPGNIDTPYGIVDYWTDRILHRSLPANTRRDLAEFVGLPANPDLNLPLDLEDEDVQHRIRSVVIVILSSPEFQQR